MTNRFKQIMRTCYLKILPIGAVLYSELSNVLVSVRSTLITVYIKSMRNVYQKSNLENNNS